MLINSVLLSLTLKITHRVRFIEIGVAGTQKMHSISVEQTNNANYTILSPLI